MSVTVGTLTIDLKRPHGFVYMATNTVTGKVYVGQTTQLISQRWRQHCADARTRRTYPLHNAIRKYGVAAFLVIEVARASSQAELNQLEGEQILLHCADVRGAGYNVRAGGESGGALSSETRRKIGESNKGRTAHNKGKKMPEHQLLAMIERFKVRHPCQGRTVSEETRRKISNAHIGKPSSFAGKTHTPEARARISLSEKGKIVPPLVRSKMSESAKRRFSNLEQRELQSRRHKGKPWTPARRAAQLIEKEVSQ